MATEDAQLTAAVTSLTTAIGQYTTDVNTGIADIKALLTQDDPDVDAAVTALTNLQTTVGASDAALQAVLAQVPSQPAPSQPSQAVAKPAGS